MFIFMDSFPLSLVTTLCIFRLSFVLADNMDKESLTASDLIDIISSDLADVWIPRRGTIYPAVKQLIHKGYIEKTDDRPMRIWISSEGVEKLPQLSEGILQNIRTYFNFIYTYQENLSDNFP